MADFDVTYSRKTRETKPCPPCPTQPACSCKGGEMDVFGLIAGVFWLLVVVGVIGTGLVAAAMTFGIAAVPVIIIAVVALAAISNDEAK